MQRPVEETDLRDQCLPPESLSLPEIFREFDFPEEAIFFVDALLPED
jgi:hypothetical protein